MSDLFVTKENIYNPRNLQVLESQYEQKVTFETETISYREPQIWNVIPECSKHCHGNFEITFKKWKCLKLHMLALLTKKLQLNFF